MSPRSLLVDRGTSAMRCLTVLVGLLQAIRQVLGVEVISLLIWLIDGAISLIAGVRQLDQVPLVYVGSVLCIFTLVVWGLLNIVKDDLEASV